MTAPEWYRAHAFNVALSYGDSPLIASAYADWRVANYVVEEHFDTPHSVTRPLFHWEPTSAPVEVLA